MRRRIYLASSWRNQQQPEVLAALLLAGHEVYNFRNPEPGGHGFSWREIAPGWKDWTAREFRDALDHPVSQHGLGLDFGGMKWADTCVMLQPCGRSAALELGWAIGAGKTTAVLLSEGQEPELMLGLAGKLCLSVDELLTWLDATWVGRPAS